jgi:hypothetical protein
MYAEAVRADEAQARAHGISAVPFFVIDGRYGIAGAQPPDVILEALERAWRERSALTVVGDAAEADACDDDSCRLAVSSREKTQRTFGGMSGHRLLAPG